MRTAKTEGVISESNEALAWLRQASNEQLYACTLSSVPFFTLPPSDEIGVPADIAGGQRGHG